MVDCTKQVVAARLDIIGVPGQNKDALASYEQLDKFLTMEYDRLCQNRLNAKPMSFFGRPNEGHGHVASAPSSTRNSFK